MARVILKNNTIQAKLVYYGPGLCGKTTNLQWVNRNVGGGQELMSLATEGDRTIFFDFMPLDLGKLRDMDVQFKLYTVPGQVRYNQTRKMVLKNVDGVVFVADSQPQMMDANLESFDNLFSNLAELGISADQVSVILQYNKRDLPAVLSREALDAALNRNKYPTFLASAHTGEGVLETLKEACRLVLRSLSSQLADSGRFKTAQNQMDGPNSASSARVKVAQSVTEAAPKAPPAPAAPAAPASRVGSGTVLRKAASPPSAQAAAPARSAAAPAAAPQTTAAQARQVASAVAMKSAAQAALAEPVPATVPAAALAATAVAMTVPQPVGGALAHPVRSAPEASPELEQALAEARRLAAELKAELEGVRADRARVAGADPFAKLESQIVTKADLQTLLGGVPSKADFRALQDRVDLLATKAEVEAAGKSPSPSTSEVTKAVDAIKHELSTMSGALKELKAAGERTQAAGADSLGKLASQIVTKADLEKLLAAFPSRADFAAVRDRVLRLATKAELDETVGKSPSSSASEVTQVIEVLKQELPALSGALKEIKGLEERAAGKLAVLPTRVDLQKRDEAAGQQAAALEKMIKKLAEHQARPEPAGLDDLQRTLTELVEHVKRAPAAVPADDLRAEMATKADLSAFAKRLDELPTKTDLEKHAARTAETPLVPELAALAKLDLVAFAERLRELPTKADLEKHAARPAGEATLASELHALKKALSELARKTDLEALDAQIRSLSAMTELWAKQSVPAAQPAPKAPASSRPTASPVDIADPKPMQAAPETEAASASEAALPQAEQREPAESVALAEGTGEAAAPAESAAEAAAPAESAAESAPPAESAAEAAAPAESAAKSKPPVESAAESAPPAESAAEAAAPAESAAESKPAAESAGEAAAPAEAAAEAAPPAAEAPAPAEPTKPEVDEFAGNRDHQAAARIARVMMADLYLYNKEHVDTGIANDDFYERNKEALADMRLTYESRVKAEVRNARDYLQLAIEEFIKKKRKKQTGVDA